MGLNKIQNGSIFVSVFTTNHSIYHFILTRLKTKGHAFELEFGEYFEFSLNSNLSKVDSHFCTFGVSSIVMMKWWLYSIFPSTLNSLTALESTHSATYTQSKNKGSSGRLYAMARATSPNFPPVRFFHYFYHAHTDTHTPTHHFLKEKYENLEKLLKTPNKQRPIKRRTSWTDKPR